MALFPINLQVEESALGTVLRVLKSLSGIAKLDLMLDDVPAPKGMRGPRAVNGNATPRNNGDQPSASTLIIAALTEHGQLHLKQLASMLPDMPKQTISGTLTALKQAGITEAVGMGVHKLSESAREEMGGKAAAATLALPQPESKRRKGADIIIEKLKQGPAPRAELIAALIENHLAASSINTILTTMQERKQIALDNGLYSVPEVPKPEVTLKRGEGRGVIIAYLNEHPVAKRSDLQRLPGMTERITDGMITRLKQEKIIEAAGTGAVRFTKDAAKKLQAKASKE